jgi:hypothetical protein
MNRVEDNSKINININVNLDKKPVSKVVGRKLENNGVITVNPRTSDSFLEPRPPVKPKSKAKSKSRCDTSTCEVQADFSNLSYQKENDRINGQ